MRNLLLISLLLLATLLHAEAVKLAPRWAEKDFAGETAIETRVLALANKERAGQTLGALTLDAALRTAARQHAAEMGAKDYFAHESPVEAWKQPWQRAYRAGYYGMAVGENIVQVHDDALTTNEAIAVRFMELWMHSPHHRENLLKPDWTLSGVGVVRVGPFLYGVQLFASPLSVIESASLEHVEGELVAVTITGTLRAGTINTWVDKQHWEKVLPKNGTFTALVALPRADGAHDITVAVGSHGVWVVHVDTDAAKAGDMLGTPRELQHGVVNGVSLDITAFRGLRLTVSAREPADKPIQVFRDDTTIAVPTPDATHHIALDLILPERSTPYVLSISVGEMLEHLLYIDTTKPLKDAFLVRPDTA